MQKTDLRKSLQIYLYGIRDYQLGDFMDNQIDEPKHILRRKGKADMKVGTIKHHKSNLELRPRRIVKKNITKGEFLDVLGKVCQPVSKESSESDSEKSET